MLTYFNLLIFPVAMVYSVNWCSVYGGSFSFLPFSGSYFCLVHITQCIALILALCFTLSLCFFLVGFDGQNNLVSCGADLDQAKKVFGKKYVQTDKLF